jgi:hypothetical protein
LKTVPKLAKFLLIVTLIVALGLAVRAPVLAQAPAAAASPAMPQGWDSRIPLPPGAVLVSSSVPNVGVVYSSDWAVKGDFKELVDFYEAELPKAGFAMGPKVLIAARKVYNRNFSTGGGLDSVVISPNTSDPAKFNVHIAWSHASAKSAPKAP